MSVKVERWKISKLVATIYASEISSSSFLKNIQSKKEWKTFVGFCCKDEKIIGKKHVDLKQNPE